MKSVNLILIGMVHINQLVLAQLSYQYTFLSETEDRNSKEIAVEIPDNQDDPAYKIYKTGYDLILDENWEEAQKIFDELGENILGLFPNRITSVESREPQLMDLIIAIRNESRKNKNFAISDKIRDDLKSAGIVVEDGKDGKTFWKKI